MPARDSRQKMEGDLGTMVDAVHATDMDTEGAGAAEPGTIGGASGQGNSGYVRCLHPFRLCAEAWSVQRLF